VTWHTDENCVLIEGLIREGQRKVPEMAQVTGIAKSSVHEIISHFTFHKMTAHWVPKNAHQRAQEQKNDFIA
jgi:hypothetical protein